MKLSTRSRYALRALLDLMKHHNTDPISIKDIAGRQKISERYLENIFHDLRKSGILSSVKGKNGGFFPGCDLREVTLLQIIEILEGDIRIVDCTARPEECTRAEECLSRPVWTNLNAKFCDYLSKIRLSDIKGCDDV
ncbi:MAG: RrF2 family transcriptional regulator [Spirochaetota bacterium]